VCLVVFMSCTHLKLCSMLYGSEAWLVRKENGVALQRAEMRMLRWMCGVKLQDRVPSKGLRETRIRWHNLGSTAKQVVMLWHVPWKDDNDWVKKCMEYELEGGATPSVLWHGWLGGRKGIRPVKIWVVGCWHGYLSGVRCRFAYGPADATATHCLLLQ